MTSKTPDAAWCENSKTQKCKNVKTQKLWMLVDHGLTGLMFFVIIQSESTL
jgi:hypothetical protein